MNPLIIKSESDYKQFVTLLKQKSKNESVEDKIRHKAIINTQREVLCISMKNIREVAKQILVGEPLEFLKLKKGETYEEVLIEGLVIAGLKDLDLQTELFDKWINKIDCWALCDSVVSTNKALLKSKFKEKYFEHYLNKCFDEKEFVARWGIINLMVNFMEDEFIDKIFQMAKSVKNEAYYVQMGLAWLLSVTYVYYREKTLELLKSKSLSKFVQNKTISKCHDSFRVSKADKDMLVSLRIK